MSWPEVVLGMTVTVCLTALFITVAWITTKDD